MKIINFIARFGKLIVLCFCLWLTTLAEAQAATFVVTKTADTNDGTCNADCSLREAVAVAGSNDTIIFNANVFNTSQVINLILGELRIVQNMTISGTGANRLTIRGRNGLGSGSFRVFNIQANTTIRNLTVSGGEAFFDFGGGILNSGTLTLENSEIFGNTASYGGGVFNSGNFNAINSTISSNSIAQGAFYRQGGGIVNRGTMTLINVTICNNIAANSQMYSSGGGGILQENIGTSILRNVTVANNTAVDGGGLSGRFTLGNTIVANNSGSAPFTDIFGTIISEGYNLFRTTPITISGNTTGNLIGINPLLDTNGLRDNGGLTRTITLQPNSPVIDKGNGTIAGVTNDQRGFVRPYNYPGIPNAQSGDGSDIGAVEVNPSVPFSILFDFNGDRKPELSVYRPSNGVWYLQQSQAGFGATQFGILTDKIVPADFDGDGKTDIAVYRPDNGVWYLLRSNLGFTAIQFGIAEDIPQPADFDGDGKAEIAVFRPSNGTWYILNLINSQFTAFQFGISEDKPVVGDYDGDNRADYAVFRPSNGVWYYQQTTAGFGAIQFGIATDKPVPADYDGDGRTDVAVYRPSNGVWYQQQSTLGFTAIQFGIDTDKPSPADYDGDGKADIAVYRPSNGIWYLQQSTLGFTAFQFGIAEDKPIPNAFVPQ